LLELARINENTQEITPACQLVVLFCIMMKEFPERTFDVGIAEQNMLLHSLQDLHTRAYPFCNIYFYIYSKSI